ncbi:C1 family peptidase [Undibacterium terreum]|uniref:Peptidase C1 n=1 Tax=Undibacterium terreum TaxID=1224302 RepID=A0A916XKX5_9BURK|nr:C1 family peptidase [Undibacterium terreum]GGC79699.1 peptidase C1 [Undibacterium terreum]
MPSKIAGYGWMPDLPDHRDHGFVLPAGAPLLPPKVDLRPYCPPVLSQGQKIGSCTSNAICNAYRFNQMKQSGKNFMPSRLFIHYNARAMIGTQRMNHGAPIREAIKSIAKQGVCHERDWPYIAKKYATKPPKSAYTEALLHQAVSYQRLKQDLEHLKACLAGGHPFVFGLTVYDSFESDAVAASGTLKMPGKKESMAGGHAVLAVGYDDKTERFTVMNSWGDQWGKKGYFTVPYAYLLESNLAADFWTIRTVEL